MSSTTILMSCPPDFRADLILRAREDGSLRTDAACEREADKLGVLYEVRQRLDARAAFAANDGDTGELAPACGACNDSGREFIGLVGTRTIPCRYCERGVVA